MMGKLVTAANVDVDTERTNVYTIIPVIIEKERAVDVAGNVNYYLTVVKMMLMETLICSLIVTLLIINAVKCSVINIVAKTAEDCT